MNLIAGAVGALVLTAVSVGVYIYKSGSSTDTFSLEPFVNRIYEIENHSPNMEIFLQKLGIKNEKFREEIINTKRGFVLTIGHLGYLQWKATGPDPPDSWPVELGKQRSWMAPDHRIITSILSLKGIALTEVQTWKQDNGKTVTWIIKRSFTKDYLTITMSLDGIKAVSKYKFKGMYTSET